MWFYWSILSFALILRSPGPAIAAESSNNLTKKDFVISTVSLELKGFELDLCKKLKEKKSNSETVLKKKPNSIPAWLDIGKDVFLFSDKINRVKVKSFVLYVSIEEEGSVCELVVQTDYGYVPIGFYADSPKGKLLQKDPPNLPLKFESRLKQERLQRKAESTVWAESGQKGKFVVLLLGPEKSDLFIVTEAGDWISARPQVDFFKQSPIAYAYDVWNDGALQIFLHYPDEKEGAGSHTDLLEFRDGKFKSLFSKTHE